MYTQLFPILTNEVIIGAGGMADATDDGDRNQRMGCTRRDPNSHYCSSGHGRNLHFGSGLQFPQLTFDQVFDVPCITLDKWSQSDGGTTLWDNHEVRPHQ